MVKAHEDEKDMDPHVGVQTDSRVSEKAKYGVLLCFAAYLMILALFFNSPFEIWQGSIVILRSTANLITDYFALANEGAALANASFMAFFSIGLAALNRMKVDGALIAAVLTVAGFSLFGKNLFNSLPIILGVLLYSRINRTPFKDHLRVALFGTALGPLVSEITFGLELCLHIGLPLALMAGLFVGLVLPPLAAYFIHFYQGLNLYNIGFTSGIVGTFFIALLRSFNVEVAPVSLISSGNNQSFVPILYLLCLALGIMGLYFNRWHMRGYGRLLRETGKMNPDFVEIAGLGLVLVNMALLGALATTYVLLVGGDLSGPVIGGIFTVMGFGAVGKHVKNVLPVLVGIFVFGMLNHEDIFCTQALLAALFGTTLAPISGCYGPIAGVIAGALHMGLVMNVGYLHAGMNLYNNGFSGGFVAAVLIPVLEGWLRLKEQLKNRKLTIDVDLEGGD